MRPCVLLTGAVAGCMALLASARADPSLEYAEKAAYLPKFIPFITWPDTAFASPTTPVTICVLGDDPFGGKLEQAASGAKSGARAIMVRHLPEPDASASCQVIFLGPGDPPVAEGTLDAMKGKPVVTVTDSGLKAHGVISFLIEANHVRFDIDDAAAAQGGLVISSKLLSLAHAVKQRGP
jgi:YfiR/HmsC-like